MNIVFSVALLDSWIKWVQESGNQVTFSVKDGAVTWHHATFYEDWYYYLYRTSRIDRAHYLELLEP